MNRRVTVVVLALGILAVTGLVLAGPQVESSGGADGEPAEAAGMAAVPEDAAVATFAGGCFWCMEPPYDRLDGVYASVSGYTGGTVANPTYEQVVRENTGHYEAVQIFYDPQRISYEELLDVFWVNVDPLDAGGQFCDRGDSYRTAIFAHSPAQATAARRSLEELEDSGRLPGPIVTPIIDFDVFWVAEDYHQDYYLKNPVRYEFYRSGCGRDARLFQLWGEDAGGYSG